MPSFLYFDLGNVLLHFDHEIACRQMAEVARLDAARVREVVFESGLENRYEAGQISSREFYDAFCNATDTRPDFERLALASSAIFWPNFSLKPVVAQLKAAGYRLGVLSNTCEAHWNYLATGRYAMIPEIFDVAALSFRIGAMKPEPKIYAAAAELAGVPAGEIFFTDDIAGHVAGARAAGFDAVQYTTTPALVAELRKRGLQFNY